MEKWMLLTMLAFLVGPRSTTTPLAKNREAIVDGCPRMALTVGCNSHKGASCCPKYSAEIAGQWGISTEKLRFKWTVTNGRIISGQNTPLIEIDTKRAKGKPILVMVQVEGLEDWAPVCKKEISLTVDNCKDTLRSAFT